MSDIFEALKQVAPPGSKYAEPNGDKYEAVARNVASLCGMDEISYDNGDERDRERLVAYLRSQFPEPNPVEWAKDIWEDAPSDMESREYATLAWVEYRNFDGTTDRSRNYHRPFHNFKPLPPAPKDGE